MLPKGWEEGLLGMCVGETREIQIPASKGYGKRGAPPAIPPDANLVFNVELLAIEAGNTGRATGWNLGEILIVIAFFAAVVAVFVMIPKLNAIDKDRRKPGAKKQQKPNKAKAK